MFPQRWKTVLMIFVLNTRIFPLVEMPVIITAESNNSQARKYFQMKTL